MVGRNYQIGGVSKICGIIYGEPESQSEGACLRGDEPPVLAQLRLHMRGGGGGAQHPPPTPPFLKPRCALANVVP